MEGFLESWTEYENNIHSLKTWFETQETKLKEKQRIGDQASVQNALKDCQVATTLSLIVNQICFIILLNRRAEYHCNDIWTDVNPI